MKSENVIDYDEVYFRSEDNNLIGLLVMTDFRLFFKFKDTSMHRKLNLSEEYFCTPLFGIAR